MAKKAKSAPEQVPMHTDTTIPQEPTPETPMEKKNVFDQPGELVVDVFETDEHFVVLAAIAGAKIQDLDIAVEKDMMIISGHRPDPHDHPKKNYFYQECYWGPFSRKIVLPENIDTGAADAQMDKGMLTITMPKVSLEKSKKAEVKES